MQDEEHPVERGYPRRTSKGKSVRKKKGKEKIEQNTRGGKKEKGQEAGQEGNTLVI